MSNNSASEVKKGLSSFDFFTIGFGAIVGVGWALSLNNWMANSGGPVPAGLGDGPDGGRTAAPLRSVVPVCLLSEPRGLSAEPNGINKL